MGFLLAVIVAQATTSSQLETTCFPPPRRGKLLDAVCLNLPSPRQAVGIDGNRRISGAYSPPHISHPQLLRAGDEGEGVFSCL